MQKADRVFPPVLMLRAAGGSKVYIASTPVTVVRRK
jgi:hypothetical protein